MRSCEMRDRPASAVAGNGTGAGGFRAALDSALVSTLAVLVLFFACIQGAYAGAVSVRLDGPNGASYPAPASFELTVAANTGTTGRDEWVERITLFRNGVAIHHFSSRGGGSYVDAGVQPGSYTYHAQAVVGYMYRGETRTTTKQSAQVAVNVTAAPPAFNDAAFVGQSVPGNMVGGRSYPVSVQMRNTGTITWLQGQHRLGAMNPYDNWTWGVPRVELPANVAPGQTVTFHFSVVAPLASNPSSPIFQWQMLQEGVQWFGQTSERTMPLVLPEAVGSISASPNPCLIPEGGSSCALTLTWTSSHHGLGLNEIWRSDLDGANATFLVGQKSGTMTVPGLTVAGSRFSLQVDGRVLASVEARAIPTPKVMGTIEGLSADGGALNGWACAHTRNEPIEVHLYLGGAYGAGVLAGTYQANQASEPAVAAACAASGGAYRFSIPLSTELRRLHADKALYVHGISPVGGANLLLGNSGALRVPENPPLATSSSTIEYDELGRMIAVKGSNGQALRYSYDDNSNVKTVTDALGRVISNSYDALNRLSERRDPAQGVVKYQYDTADRVVSITDARGLVNRYDYDGLGQLWTQTSPDTGVSRIEYDASGLRRKLTRHDGSSVSYHYDAIGRLARADAGAQWREFSYDSCAQGGGNSTGRLCAIRDSHGNGSAFGYTPQGELALRRDLISVDGQVGDHATHWRYDGIGRLTAIDYPSGVGVGYAYQRDRLASVTASVGGQTYEVASDLRYRPFGPVESWRYGNGLFRRYNYDADGRMFGLSTGDASDVVQSQTYGFNAADEIVAITNGLDAARNRRYEYDRMGRLAADANRDWRWGHDANGNRTSFTAPGVLSSFAIDAASNRLHSHVRSGGTTQYGHDALGNRSWMRDPMGDEQTYAYDGFGRLSRIDRLSAATGTTATTRQSFNAQDQRVAKVGALGVTRFFYQEQNQLLAEQGGAGWKSYVWLDGRLVGMVLADGSIRFVHDDHLGRPESVTDAGRTVVWRADNDAFGRMVLLDAIGGLPLGFPGQYQDAETGLWQNGFRTYDESLGRYLESDPIGLAGGLNPYVYVDGNPVAASDPEGLASKSPYAYGTTPPPWFTRTEPRAAGKISNFVTKQIVSKLTGGLFTVNKWNQIIPAPRVKVGAFRAGPLLFGASLYLTPSDISCGDLDCDQDGVADYAEAYWDAMNQCPAGLGAQAVPFIVTQKPPSPGE